MGVVGVLSNVIPSESFGIGTMPIQHLCYGFLPRLVMACVLEGVDLSRQYCALHLRCEVKMYLAFRLYETKYSEFHHG